MSPSPFHAAPAFADSGRPATLAGGFPALDQAFERFASAHRVPGMAYGVVIDGTLAHSAGIGMADVEAGRSPASDTVFRMASMTKSFTAMCVLSLRDQGALDLDDPAAAHVPELRSLRPPTSDSPPITIRSLMSMSSGLVEDDPWADRLLGQGSDDFSELLAGGIAFDLATATGFEYSNLGYAILGRIASNVAGMPLAKLAQERIFAPLGMEATTFDAPGIPAGRAAIGYRLEAGEWVHEPPLPDGAFGAMGGLATSVEDLARYVAMHLAAWPARDDPEDGPLPRSSLREMATAHTAAHTFLSGDRPRDWLLDGYGYGLVAAVHPRDGRVVAHSGGIPGFGSHMEWLPDHGVGIVAFANRTYVPVRTVVREGFDALAATGALQPRVRPASAGLVAARDAITRLYNEWDEELAAATMLPTYFLDRDDGRHPPDLAALRVAHGEATAAGDIAATGALRGRWRMACPGGDLDVDVMLGPGLPVRVQFVTVTPVGASDETSAP